MILKSFKDAESPLSAVSLLEAFSKLNVSVHKTTIYRDLEKLSKLGIIKPIDFGDGVKRFELSDVNHHHHLICTKCTSIEDIELDKDLSKEEQKIEQTKQFKVSRHSLEFFGICKGCQI